MQCIGNKPDNESRAWDIADYQPCFCVDHFSPYSLGVFTLMVNSVMFLIQAALMLLLGCVFLDLGVALEVIPNVLILPGEGLVRVIAGFTGWRFGRCKNGI